MGDLNFDQIRRALSDLVAELHARRLAIPAGVMLVAILAAIFVMPKSSSPPPAQTVAVPVPSGEEIERPAQVSLKMVGVSSLEDDIALTDSSNPFYGTDSAKCTQISGSNPKKFDCMIGDLLVRVTCPPANSQAPPAGICAPKTAGASGSTGATAETGAPTAPGIQEFPEFDNGTGGGGETMPNDDSSSKESYYVIEAKLDDETFSNIAAGDPLPNSQTVLVTYAGTNSKNTKAIFIAGDGVVVTGVSVDPSLGTFELSKGGSATLTDSSGVAHFLTLESISKVSGTKGKGARKRQ